MNFTIERKVLDEALMKLTRVLSTTMMLPIYKGVFIKVEKDRIVLIVSDGTVSMQEIIKKNIKVFETGECVVDGKLLLEIIKRTNNGELWIKCEKNQLKIKSNKADLKLLIYANAQYPTINFSFPETRFKLDAGKLSEGIEKTIFSCSDKETRPVLGGLNFIVDSTQCIITGTDSYRLSHVKLPVICDNQINITIPKKLLTLLSLLFTGHDEVYLYFSKNKALISNENCIIQTVLLEGKFPDLDQLIPKSFETELVLNRKILLEALERTSYVKQEGVTIVGLEILNDEIVITSESQEVGSTIETITMQMVNGNKNVKFYCNGQYMIEAVKAFNEETIYLKYNADNKPFLITGSQQENHIQLLLPVRHR